MEKKSRPANGFISEIKRLREDFARYVSDREKIERLTEELDEAKGECTDLHDNIISELRPIYDEHKREWDPSDGTWTAKEYAEWVAGTLIPRLVEKERTVLDIREKVEQARSLVEGGIPGDETLIDNVRVICDWYVAVPYHSQVMLAKADVERMRNECAEARSEAARLSREATDYAVRCTEREREATDLRIKLREMELKANWSRSIPRLISDIRSVLNNYDLDSPEADRDERESLPTGDGD